MARPIGLQYSRELRRVTPIFEVNYTHKYGNTFSIDCKQGHVMQRDQEPSLTLFVPSEQREIIWMTKIIYAMVFGTEDLVNAVS